VRLLKFRKKAIAVLRQQIEGQLQINGGDVAQALAYFAEMYFPDNVNMHWPAFFSCIRWYLGEPAENRLKLIQYNG
jgi:hypothetical protein